MSETCTRAKSSIWSRASKRYLSILAWAAMGFCTSVMSSPTISSRAATILMKSCGRNKPPIQELFQRGDEVLVQVIKEGIGNKGPTLSTYISIPGRFLVLMPALGRVGVSRKIEDEDERRRLKDILYDLDPPKGLGFIVRTAGAKKSRDELARDLEYLLRLWKAIVKRVQTIPAPIDIYEESDIVIRTIRDVLSSDICQNRQTA